MVECQTPEREVRGSRPTAAVLCPWARHFTPRKYWLITQEAMAPSRHDWKIVDWDVKPQHNQPTPKSIYMLIYPLKLLLALNIYHILLCPQLRRSWGGILLWGCPSAIPFVMIFDACHILWTVHARVLKYGKIADLYFFLVRFTSLCGVMPFEKIRIKSCQQYISKSIWARGLKLGL